MVIFMAEKTQLSLQHAFSQFKTDELLVSCMPYGNGHINDTFLAITASGRRYILQAINTYVFKKPEEVMSNIERVTAFLRKKNDNPRGVLTLIPTKEDTAFFRDQDGCVWRLYDFIENSICLDFVESPKDFYECGFAFGKFQRDLSDFPADTLFETIPDFHNTPKRYQDFTDALRRNPLNRAQNAKSEIAFLTEREDFTSILLHAHMRGELPLRVSHNDTKSNNVMLDFETRRALCVIDLDTIMPGFSVTDFGDAIRFGASTATEDEQDLSKVHFDLSLFEIYTKGFLAGAAGELKKSELLLLPEGAKMMTLECGMRFLTDYLEGDVYFKTAYPEHNLVRARTQLKLVSEMENHWDNMKKIVSVATCTN